MVRNRTPSEVQESVEASERHFRETKFFSSAPWNVLPFERLGTQALKRYLAELLSNRTLESFPTILTTLRDRIKSTTVKLEGLGLARGTPEEKRAFLTKIAQEFSSLASQALRGRYDSLTANNLKLRRLVREANDKFSSEMKTSGHAVPFFEQPEVKGTAWVPSFGFSKPTGESSSLFPVRGFPPFSKNLQFHAYTEKEGRFQWVFQNSFMTGWSQNYSFEELRLSDYTYRQAPPKIDSAKGGLTTPSAPNNQPPLFPPAPSGSATKNASPGLFAANSNSKDVPGLFAANNNSKDVPGLFAANNNSKDVSQGRELGEIYKWITLEVQANRGTELQGTFNPDILPALFHKQIVKWKAYSEIHFLQVTKITTQTLFAILSVACPDAAVRGRLEQAIRRASETAEKRGLKQLSDRLTTLGSGHLQTNNSSFVEKVRIARLRRFQAALERYRSRHTNPAPKPQPQGFGSGFGALGQAEEENKFTIDMRDTAALFDELHVSNAQNLADEIHDVLKAYYELARDDFIEYVNHLIVEPFLNSPDGPVMFFSPLHVSAMPTEQLESLAIEEVSLVRQRTDLASALVRLKRAETIALKYS